MKMKTYATKSNMKRAALAELLLEFGNQEDAKKAYPQRVVEAQDASGNWFYTIEDTPSVGTTSPTSSTIKNPCLVVWEIATEMTTVAGGVPAKRKDILQACVDRGVNFYTARTQYQLWKQAGK